MKTINELKITSKNWDDSWVELQKKLLVHRGNLKKPKQKYLVLFNYFYEQEPS